MGELTTTNQTALAQYGGDDPFASHADDLGNDNAAYLKFNGNTGDYTYGAENEELEHGSRVVVDMNLAARGWICWNDGEVVEEINVPLVDGKPPRENELQDHGPYADDDDGWSEQVTLFMAMSDGTKLCYKATSKSGKRAFAGLVKDYSKQWRTKPDQLPIVEIDATSFQPKDKKLGTKYAPKLRIVDWIHKDELAEMTGEDPSDYDDDGFGEDELPVTKESTPEPAPAPEPETQPEPEQEQEAAPARRGRRGARKF